ncbi:hypothetical protein A3A14_03395 [Candidatus Daviesbacteria bacterium RIFCSPLOWO2_01_FULL_43_38]|uniref:Uncharacterized protein n=3 Tax=Candidatus Daviesiibacteriota TaxID=1752718 RepID=A0A1F5K797_9BACT|nr:MAG: hypothetical protein UV33_C0001G0007 [Candidatus Daviesbacteria bacterium GW2011_GWA1_42_6]KKS69916.1 MAG: hypothetical protein UV41_C0041G0003 [Candidatus Daviesbacteria bacterium GW2011_GWA2_42_7]OGE20625.1 MAG: hypothetical protein A2874_02020 [Candidatus Daviesbacteria bacterium RIFCSPHIGHO2_01_FULL_43_17]OGE36769.1 MAG: hypothetical protein A3E45_01440 [Candidatus Daviesbacteria bacterium RIFCSPHIGHO2_12_FULL_43_11]OGE63687.1 MAG: hypothetical protein A3A14_03395 [Candidatus Davies
MTLTQAAVWTKRGIIGTIVSIILIILAVTGSRMWYQYQLSLRPPVEEKPEMKFGSLPKIQFPPSEVTSSNFSYSIDTVTGGLPEVLKLIKVYFIPQTSISLLSSDRAQKLAESLGFSSSPEILSPARYKFKDDKGGTLTIDLTTGNFHIQKQIEETATGSAQLNTASPPGREQLVTEFKNYLTERNLLIKNIENGKTNVTFKGPSPDKWEIAYISILPPDWDNIPTVTASFSHGLVKATAKAAGDGTSKYINIGYTVWQPDKTTYSTYPLKTAEQALADLRSGLGFVSIEPAGAQVSISSVYLAYFQPEDYSPYLQPVFVFEGPGFTALVPAASQN